MNEVNQIALDMIVLAEEDLGRELTTLEKVAVFGAAGTLVSKALQVGKNIISPIIKSKQVASATKSVKSWGGDVANAYKTNAGNFAQKAAAGLRAGSANNPYLTAGAIAAPSALAGAALTPVPTPHVDQYQNIRTQYADVDDHSLAKEADEGGSDAWKYGLGLGTALGMGFAGRGVILRNRGLREMFDQELAGTRSVMQDIANNTATLRDIKKDTLNTKFGVNKLDVVKRNMFDQIKSHIDDQFKSVTDIMTAGVQDPYVGSYNNSNMHNLLRASLGKYIDDIERAGELDPVLVQELRTYLADKLRMLENKLRR